MSTRTAEWIVGQLVAGKTVTHDSGLRVYRRERAGRVIGYGVTLATGHKYEFSTLEQAAHFAAGKV